jgi:toxin ParE1/3/4
MNYTVSILSEAELDIDNAFIWYEIAQIGLGNDFFETVNKSVLFISNNPFSCTEIYNDIRRFVIKKFPYGIYYKVKSEEKEIQIIGVIHFKRSKRIMRTRI